MVLLLPSVGRKAKSRSEEIARTPNLLVLGSKVIMADEGELRWIPD
jgi:hypothetical protein